MPQGRRMLTVAALGEPTGALILLTLLTLCMFSIFHHKKFYKIVRIF